MNSGSSLAAVVATLQFETPGNQVNEFRSIRSIGELGGLSSTTLDSLCREANGFNYRLRVILAVQLDIPK